jgi:hypothetical protein
MAFVAGVLILLAFAVIQLVSVPIRNDIPTSGN